MNIREKDIARFWDYVTDQSNPDACWEWRASSVNGFGQFWVGGKVVGAHRLAYTITNGELPDRVRIKQTCGNTLCVNPSHLYISDARVAAQKLPKQEGVVTLPFIVSPPEAAGSADAYRKYLGTSFDPDFAPQRKPMGQRRKVVAVGDLHGLPAKWVARRIVEEQPDTIVIGGDLLDSKQASPHKNDDTGRNPRTMKHESASVRGFIEFLLANTEANIDVMRGNHDQWLPRRLRDADLEWLIDFYGDPLELLIAGLGDRVALVKTEITLVVPDGYEEMPSELQRQAATASQFILLMGDAVLSHMNFTSKLSGAAVKKFHEWISEWHKPFGWPEPALCIQFHGHKSNMATTRMGWLKLVEPGMAAMPQTEDYKMQYQGTWHPGTVDGCVFEQELVDGEWQTVMNSVRLLSTQ